MDMAFVYVIQLLILSPYIVMYCTCMHSGYTMVRVLYGNLIVLLFRLRSSNSSGTPLDTDRTETVLNTKTCPVEICSSQQQQSCQVSVEPARHSPSVTQFDAPPSCTSTPTYCASLYHDHMNPCGSKSDSGYSSSSTSVRASFISNTIDNCETSEHESPEFLYYGHELYTRSPERAYGQLSNFYIWKFTI